MITTKIANYCFKIINNIVIRATAKISRGGGVGNWEAQYFRSSCSDSDRPTTRQHRRQPSVRPVDHRGKLSTGINNDVNNVGGLLFT